MGADGEWQDTGKPEKKHTNKKKKRHEKCWFGGKCGNERRLGSVGKLVLFLLFLGIFRAVINCYACVCVSVCASRWEVGSYIIQGLIQTHLI